MPLRLERLRDQANSCFWESFSKFAAIEEIFYNQFWKWDIYMWHIYFQRMANTLGMFFVNLFIISIKNNCDIHDTNAWYWYQQDVVNICKIFGQGAIFSAKGGLKIFWKIFIRWGMQNIFQGCNWLPGPGIYANKNI